MGKTSTASKHKWNTEHYTQVKVSVLPEIAQAFKEQCKVNGVSMAGEISRFMSGAVNESSPAKKSALGVETRAQRRKTLAVLIRQLAKVVAAEAEYRERIPENLQNSCRYEAADCAIANMENALDCLNEVYQ